MKDIIKVNLGEDHILESSTDIIGRAGEGNSTRLEISIPAQLQEWNIYLDFEMPSGETLRTPKLGVSDGVAIYDIVPYLLTIKGEIKVQVVVEKEGKTWKSSTKKYNNLYGINASNKIPGIEDFISQAQALINELSAYAPAGLVGKYETVINNTSELETFLKTTFGSMGSPEIKFVSILDIKGTTIFGGGHTLITIIKQLGGYGVIKAIRYYDNLQVAEWNRLIYSNIWHGWDWVDPPMVIGSEYRTTERWNGKVVYTKLVNYGLIAVDTTETQFVSHGISCTGIIKATGTIGNITLPFHNSWDGDIVFDVTTGNIRVTVLRNDSIPSEVGTSQAYFQIWYTKD